jgi:hypothetical protein
MADDMSRSSMGGRKVSRRWVLRTTAGLTTGVVAAGGVTLAAGRDGPSAADALFAPDHDPHTGEIFDRERHHHWDTV